MIVWFNCKISDIRLTPQPRYHLRTDDRLDVAKYSLASFRPLDEVTSKWIFNFELADGCAGKEKEFEDWIRENFPADKTVINWYRCNHYEQWQEMADLVNAEDDELIFPAGNEDHIFMDTDIELFKEGLELVKNDSDPNAVFFTSHYPELARCSFYFNPEGITENKHFTWYVLGSNDALRVMKKGLFNEYVQKIKNNKNIFYRTEDWNQLSLPVCKIYCPTKEQFRHYDGYAHVRIGADIAPPLEIPAGFFDKSMTIKYGFDQREEGAVNINPQMESFFAEDGAGTDYKFSLEDIPLFWKEHIKEIQINPDSDSEQLIEARDAQLLKMSRCEAHWDFMGIVFDNNNYPPAERVNCWTKSIDFTDE
jgi:hypothetical protein